MAMEFDVFVFFLFTSARRAKVNPEIIPKISATKASTNIEESDICKMI